MLRADSPWIPFAATSAIKTAGMRRGFAIVAAVGAMVVAGCGSSNTPQTCSEGYEDDGVTCIDIDECTQGTDNCAENATCTNTEGSFTCTCPTGHTGDGTACADSNECNLGTDDCSVDADCTNTVGSFTCACKAGYEGDGLACAEIDECGRAIDDCAADAECTNTYGSYTCQCLTGFEGDGKTCADIDECEEGLNDCASDAYCTNTSASFDCTCNEGYDGDGLTCADFDECLLAIDDCSDDAECANTVGSYDCTCNPGFDGDGVACADVTHWVIGATVSSGITLLDTDTMVAHGPYLKGMLGSSGSGLFDVVVTSDGNTAILTSFGDARVFFVDITVPTSPTVIGKVDLPMFAEDIALSPDGKYALVTDGGFSAYIVSIDVQAREIVQAKRENGVMANAVEIAPDGTVITANYFEGAINTFVMDDAGKLTYSNKYQYFVRADGAASDDPRAHLPRPVNIGISPDGKTVLVPDITPYNDTVTALDRVVETTGFRKFAVGVYTITAPGVLSLSDVVSGLPRAAQSMDFNRTGDKAYLLGNAGGRIDQVHDVIPEDEFDLLMVMDITAPGVATYDPAHSANLGRYCGSQLFGVDNIVVDRDKAYVSYSTLSLSNVNMRVITVVDLNTFNVTRVAADAIITGLAKIPLQVVDVDVPEATATCAGLCAPSDLASNMFYSGGANREAGCFCDDACAAFGDCCTDYETVCTACNPRSCTDGHVCTNTDDGFACGCPWGTLENGAGACVQDNPCLAEGGDELCPEGASCEYDFDVGYRCACPEGLWSDGSRGCECPKGFVDDGEGLCVDVDECAEGTHDCQPTAVCENNDGGYDCDCSEFEEIGLEPDMAGGCSCPGGFAPGEDGVCADIDECAINTDNCVDPSVCVNVDYGFQCNCPPENGEVSDGFGGCMCNFGYEYGDDGVCVDTDECVEGTSNCDSPATCNNGAGNYYCTCPDGYGWDEDGFGGCRCPIGYEDTGTGCFDIDECEDGTAGCDSPAICTNYDSSFSCDCPEGSGYVPDGWGGCLCTEGFEDSGVACVDIDECDQDLDNCVEPATCSNFPGGFTCVCPEGSGYVSDGLGGCECPDGFEDTGSGCVDIDECLLESDDCVDPATCANVPGAFTCECPEGYGYVSDGNGGCVCPPGFTDSGTACVDADECALETDNCTGAATCQNVEGGFICECPEGTGYVPDESGGCSCNPGYLDTGVGCTEIDECEQGTDNCIEPATCINQDGWFQCQCPDGYYWSGAACYDIDECAWGWDDCGDLTCFNTDGSFYCE